MSATLRSARPNAWRAEREVDQLSHASTRARSTRDSALRPSNADEVVKNFVRARAFSFDGRALYCRPSPVTTLRRASDARAPRGRRAFERRRGAGHGRRCRHLQLASVRRSRARRGGAAPLRPPARLALVIRRLLIKRGARRASASARRRRRGHPPAPRASSRRHPPPPRSPPRGSSPPPPSRSSARCTPRRRRATASTKKTPPPRTPARGAPPRGLGRPTPSGRSPRRSASARAASRAAELHVLRLRPRLSRVPPRDRVARPDREAALASARARRGAAPTNASSGAEDVRDVDVTWADLRAVLARRLRGVARAPPARLATRRWRRSRAATRAAGGPRGRARVGDRVRAVRAVRGGDGGRRGAARRDAAVDEALGRRRRGDGAGGGAERRRRVRRNRQPIEPDRRSEPKNRAEDVPRRALGVRGARGQRDANPFDEPTPNERTPNERTSAVGAVPPARAPPRRGTPRERGRG